MPIEHTEDAKPLRQPGMRIMVDTLCFLFLCSLPISVLSILDTEANKFYDRNYQLYDAALLNRCYTQHALCPFIDSETNHKLKSQVFVLQLNFLNY